MTQTELGTETGTFIPWSDLVGKWFQSYNADGQIEIQGMILALVRETANDSYYIVRKHIAMSDSANVVRLARLSDMTDWVFYNTQQEYDARVAYNYYQVTGNEYDRPSQY